MLRCESCGAALGDDAINLDLMVASCNSCGSVFEFAEPAASPHVEPKVQDPTEVRPKVAKAPTAKPSGLNITKRDGAIELTHRWFGCQYLFLVLFCVFWDGFMVMWFGIALSEGEALMALFGTIHGSVGVGLTYYTICGFVNKTIVTIEPDKLSVAHGPMPWPGNKTLAASDLDQLYCKTVRHQNKGNVSYTYNLMADLTDGRTVKVLTGIREQGLVRYMEQYIEDHFGIEDRY
ncbi:MAG: hypothetical protein HN348_13555 [Proteobacteria bacterium]|jgi:hypothetical protein|nr:hypothetical protein [Pseudomonadota bacterium]